MSNPLLDMTGLPPFSHVRPEHIESAVDALLAENRSRVQALLGGPGPYTWDNLAQPLEDMQDRLDRVWSPVSHLNAVMNSEPLRAAYNACLPKLSAYATELGQDERLYRAYQTIAEGEEYTRLDTARKKIIDNALRDFRLTGVDLPPERKDRFKTVMQKLSSLQATFEENLLDATQGWRKHVIDPDELAGMTDTALALARQTAQQRGLDGWLFTLEFPSYITIMTYADRRALREEMYRAYVTRASDQGPNAGRWDNTPAMERILALRHETARLLGFASYAEYSLATKMAKSTHHVMAFLDDLARRALSAARREMEELRTYARDEHGVDDLQAWDIAYYTEKLRQHKYAISQEELKPYFPEPRVVAGLFAVVGRLYGLSIREVKGVDVWHPDVRFYEIRDARGELRGQFYLDLYARPHKRGGAWMGECVTRKRNPGGTLQIPVAFLTCNLSPPLDGEPALFTHEEVLTLFHEFGHGLHHLLTRVDYPSVAGINGVAWDAVELPSQFMENWCWEREALDLISGHYKTGELLPEALYRHLREAKNFQTAMQMVRQVEFALFDFRLHLEYDPARGARVYELLREVREQVAVIRRPDYDRFAHGFSHVFAGGYAAGYYSYKWAEVLSSDAYALFEENGVFDRAIGLKFLTTILEQGGSREPLELFVEFRGREPSIDALLRHSGLAA